ncbi:hypothetical protein [Tabrizicola sp. M-4]|uniref:hypothetical protein n=1 Tax=Tabrizicola sp. M-4 TaxID=3055847 RepID=UPI003DA8A72C
MKRQLFAAALGVAFFNGMATAQEFKGDITLGYSAFTSDTSLNTLSGTGSFEFGIGDRASVQLDLGIYGFGLIGVEGGNVVLHGIYDVHPQGSLGLFLGVDSAGGQSDDFYGIEYGQSFGAGSFEVYGARGKEAGVTGTIIGAEALFELNPTWGLGVKADNADYDGQLDATRIGVKGIHALGQGTTVFAEVGSARFDDGTNSISEPFVGVGLNFQLGGGKATFGQRSQFALIPGL